MNTIFDHALWVSPLFWTLMLLGVAIILFVHNKIRMDVVALLVMLSFYLTGILSIQEILVGFSDPNIILIALLFIVGESLVRTGIAIKCGRINQWDDDINRDSAEPCGERGISKRYQSSS